MSCSVDIEVCDCDCHEGYAMHVVACCVTCPVCRKRICTEFWRDHEKRCGATKGGTDNAAG